MNYKDYLSRLDSAHYVIYSACKMFQVLKQTSPKTKANRLVAQLAHPIYLNFLFGNSFTEPQTGYIFISWDFLRLFFFINHSSREHEDLFALKGV